MACFSASVKTRGVTAAGAAATDITPDEGSATGGRTGTGATVGADLNAP